MKSASSSLSVKPKPICSSIPLIFSPVRHVLLASVGAHQCQGHLPSGPHLHHLGHIGHIAGLLLPVPLGLFCQIGSSLRGFPRFFLFGADFISIPQALFFRKSASVPHGQTVNPILHIRMGPFLFQINLAG